MASTSSLKANSEKKTEGEILCLVWLDPNAHAHENKDAEQKLRSIINSLKKFQEVKPCQKYIEQSSKTDQLVLTVTGQFGREIIPNIHGLSQVISIYIFCYNTKTHAIWALQYPKIKAVVNNFNKLLTQIAENHSTQQKADEPLPIDIFTITAGADQSTMDVNGQFVFSQVLFDCLLRLKYNDADRTELISCCKREHENNHNELKNICEYENNYTPEKAVQWYTKDSFLYKSLNAALRTQNIHMIVLFRQFISDIQRQLQKLQSTKVLKVYRGQMMSNEEVERLKQSIGKLISINSFFSTTINYAKAFFFLNPSRSLQRVLFEIEADPKMTTTKPFADISRYSIYPDEAEVLFMIGSIFRLESIRQDDKDVWIIRMILSSDEEHGLREVLLYMKGQVESGESNLRTLGRFLWKMGKFDLAEKYLLRQLEELQPNDPLHSVLYEDLAELAALKGNYDMSVQYQHKSLRLKSGKEVNETKSLPSLPDILAQQLTIKPNDNQPTATVNETNPTVAKEVEAQQFQQWLENYMKQYMRTIAQQPSTTKRHPNSVENFCYVLENHSSITDNEQRTLRGLINFGFTFDDINSEECIKLFRGIQKEKIILILSKTSMENLAKSIREEPYLSGVYVIDSSKENSFDLRVYRGSFPNVASICKQLERDLTLFSYDLTAICSIPADYTKISTFNYVQTLKSILLEADEKQNLKKEMIDFCREKYAGNDIQLKLIDEFENTFESTDAVQWFSRQETFVYKMLTRAFRILDVDVLYKLRYIIQHLHHQLQSSSEHSPLTVYRALRVRKDLLKKMCSYPEGVLSFNEFLFANINQPTTTPSRLNMETKLVIFQMNLEEGVPRHTISGKSDEILLTIGTVFRIDSVKAINEDTFVAKVTTNSNIQNIGQQISKDIYGAAHGPFPLVSMVKLIRQRELTDYMEYFANMLEADPRTTDDKGAVLSLAWVLHALGGHYYDEKQYDQGLIHLHHALEIYLRVLPPNDTRISPTYNNIGTSYLKQNLYEKALEYQLKAYEIQKNAPNPDIESVAAYAGNLTAVLDKLGRYKEALKYAEISLKIQLKINSNQENSDLAVKYHNLAGRQYRLQLYSEALENYEKCLSIELKCHSADNPTVAVTYHNMATALDKLGRVQEAKVAIEKAIERLLLTKKEDDEEVQMNRRYLKQFEQKLWMKDLFASS